jgi:hypothetical protein
MEVDIGVERGKEPEAGGDWKIERQIGSFVIQDEINEG